MFSRKAIYAIGAAVHLAHEHGKAPVKVERIATSENIPRKFLEAIMLDLKLAELCHSTRGKQGGYVLARSPADITVAQILQAVGSPIAVPMSRDSRGPAANPERDSPVRLLSDELQAAVRHVTERRTLESLAKEAALKAAHELDFVI